MSRKQDTKLRVGSSISQIGSILSFAGWKVSVSVTQFCCLSRKATTDNTQTNGQGLLKKKAYVQKRAESQVWRASHSQPRPALNYHTETI